MGFKRALQGTLLIRRGKLVHHAVLCKSNFLSCFLWVWATHPSLRVAVCAC